MSQPEPLSFRYRFKFRDGTQKEILVNLDRETLSLVPRPEHTPPAWTELTYHQCPNCPLQEKYCPVAVNLSEATDFFHLMISHDEVDAEIWTEERTFSKRVSIQKVLSSLLGMYMATSGCPHLDKLKPLARYHLPFATVEETQFRILSAYLLAQYFLQKKGEVADWELKGLSGMYREIRIVNQAFAKRLRSLRGKDAVPNAVAILDAFANAILFSVDKNLLAKIEKNFAAYLKE